MREKEPSTRIIFVRHGQTDFPTDRIYCDDREDPPLNNDGVAQARDAGDLLRLQAVDAIYTSPSSRTRMTAEEISRHARVSVPVVTENDLLERRFGIWDGLYFKDIAEKYADEYKLWKRDPVNYTPEGGETIETLLNRVNAVVQGIITKHRGGTVVIVSHVGPIRVCLTAALQIPLQGYRQLRIDYGSLTRVDFGATQNNLVFFNVCKSLNYKI